MDDGWGVKKRRLKVINKGTIVDHITVSWMCLKLDYYFIFTIEVYSILDVLYRIYEMERNCAHQDFHTEGEISSLGSEKEDTS